MAAPWPSPRGLIFSLGVTLSPTVPWCRDADGDRDPSGECSPLTGYPNGGSGWIYSSATRIDCDDSNAAVNRLAAEECNGLDDDCDGLTDGADPSLRLRQCAMQRGTCQGSRNRSDECVGGSWLTCAPANYGPDYGRSETVCSVGDFNCDGVVGMALVPCPNQLGVCAGADTASCGACPPTEYGPDFEGAESRCDGLDNDCNGVIDDAPLVPCERALGLCFGATSSPALCSAQGRRACGAREYGRGFEDRERSCDGLDNDCDGRTDFADPDIDELPCEKTAGVCASARHEAWQCGPMGLEACPEPSYGSLFQGVETRCDGLDNDCDGVTDETCGAQRDAGVGPVPVTEGCGCSTHPTALLLGLALFARCRRARRLRKVRYRIRSSFAPRASWSARLSSLGRGRGHHSGHSD